MNPLSRIFCLISILLSSVATHATTSIYIDSTAFNTAVSGYTTSILNFDSSVADSLIADGGTLGGITFNYPTLDSGVSMQILDTYSATSGVNYLGTNVGGAFLSGDVFNLSFASANAIGMFFLTGDELLDGDILLTVGATIASLSSTYEATLTDGSYVYFLGLFDDTHAFSSAEVASVAGEYFEFNVDDIITATTPSNSVPTPSVIWLLVAGLLPMLRNIKARS